VIDHRRLGQRAQMGADDDAITTRSSSSATSAVTSSGALTVTMLTPLARSIRCTVRLSVTTNPSILA
jgi:hypothetical protein